MTNPVPARASGSAMRADDHPQEQHAPEQGARDPGAAAPGATDELAPEVTHDRVGDGEGGQGVTDAPLSSSIGDYLKTIWQLARDGSASTGDIARELGVTAPSVTGMLGKMNGLGLVRYQPYRGAELSPDGRREALRLVRRHRLLETFMITELGFGWEEVHAEAELMEHVVSDDFTERLATHLGEPEFDPHGDPIPHADGTLPAAPNTPLADLRPGERFRVHRVLSQDRDVLGYLESIGIEPGSELSLRLREPGGHLLQLELNGGRNDARRRQSEERENPASSTPGEQGHSRELALSRELASVVLGKVV